MILENLSTYNIFKHLKPQRLSMHSTYQDDGFGKAYIAKDEEAHRYALDFLYEGIEGEFYQYEHKG